MFRADVWTTARLEELKFLWARGDSASMIANVLTTPEMAFSRNAVIGKARRLGLDQRRKIALPGGERKPEKERVARTRKAAPDLKAIAQVTQIINRPPPPVIECIPAPKSFELTLMELELHNCRWPTGEREHITFCGHRIEDGRPYCAYHVKLAYNPRATQQQQKTVADLVKKAA